MMKKKSLKKQKNNLQDKVNCEAREGALGQKIKQLEVEVSLLRDAYFQLEKTILKEKKTAKSLKEAKDFSEGILSSMSDGITVVGQDCTILFANKALLDAWGKNIIGKKCYNIWRANKKQCKLCPLRNKLRVGESKTIEISGLVNDKVLLGTHTGIRWKDDSFAVLEVFKDITERKKAEERVKKVNELRKKFVTVISHQLRTPLASVVWNLEMLMGGDVGKLKEEQTALLRANHGRLNDLIRIIAELMELIDIEENRITLSKEETNIDELCQSVIQDYQQQAKLKQIKLTKITPKRPMPKLNIDFQKIRNAMDHFINNAIIYTPEKGRVTINLQVKKGKVRFETTDTGIGIPKEEQDKIFSKFFRASNAMKTITDLSGVGLAVSKHYIEQHNGTVGFTSKQNKGSTFWFELPVEENEETAEPEKESLEK